MAQSIEKGLVKVNTTTAIFEGMLTYLLDNECLNIIINIISN